MAFTPFMQGTDAQSVINNYLGQNVSASTPMSPMDMNQYGVFRNPYSPEGFYANETDMYPVESYTAPVIDDEGIPTCQAGYVYDEILKQCVYVGYEEPNQNSGRDDSQEDTRTDSQKMYDEMKKDLSNPFGAMNFMNKYESGVDADGNPIYTFNPNKGVLPFLGISLFDKFTGGPKRREEKFGQAMNTLIDQTKSKFFEDNPLAFGKGGGDLFTLYSPENYLNQVRDVMIDDGLNQATVGTMLDSVGNAKQGVNITDTEGNVVYQTPTRQVNSGQQGTEISRNLGSLLKDDGKRDNTAYQSAIAKNIARTLSGSPHSTGSGFSTTLGGFYKGR